MTEQSYSPAVARDVKIFRLGQIVIAHEAEIKAGKFGRDKINELLKAEFGSGLRKKVVDDIVREIVGRPKKEAKETNWQKTLKQLDYPSYPDRMSKYLKPIQNMKGKHTVYALIDLKKYSKYKYDNRKIRSYTVVIGAYTPKQFAIAYNRGLIEKRIKEVLSATLEDYDDYFVVGYSMHIKRERY